MATGRNKSIIGDFRGKLGQVVLSESFGVATARSAPGKGRRQPLSAKQKMHTSAFGKISSFLRAATKVINLGYQQPKNPRMSRFNAAVSWHFQNALTGDPENAVITMEKLCFSCPVRKTQKAWEPELAADAENKVTVAWKLNPRPQKCTQLDDTAVIVIYDNHIKRFMVFGNAAPRSNMIFTWQADVWQKGHELYWYMFMISSDKKLVSETQYLGMTILKA